MKAKISADRRRHASRTRRPFFTPAANRPRDSSSAATVQAKLRIGAPGDRFEREADRVADQVVSIGSAPEVQRMCAGCAEEEAEGVRRQPLEEEEEEEVLQTKPDPAAVPGPAAGEGLSQRLRSHRGRGRGLPSPLLEEMSGAFGRDFADVKIHTGGEAQGLSRELGAQAFTHGEEIYFGRGKFAPDSTAGRHLLAHELTHVVQQGAAFFPSPGEGRARPFFQAGGGAATEVRRMCADCEEEELQASPEATLRRQPAEENEIEEERLLQTKPDPELRRQPLEPEEQPVEGGGLTVVQRKVAFDTPAEDRRDPAGRILRDEPTGLTTPTADGTQLPDDFALAGQLIFKMLTPRTAAYDAATSECRFEDFSSSLSANVIVPTAPAATGWSTNIPGADVKGVPTCHANKSVPVSMTGDPDDKTILAWIESNEQEHVDDLKAAHLAHLETYFTDMLAMRATDPDRSKCIEKLMTDLGSKDGLAAKDFLDTWVASIKARDDAGGHTLKNKINVKSGCSAIEIESKK